MRLGDPAANNSLMDLLANDCRSRAQGKRYFPISVLREAGRRYLKQTTFDPSGKLLFYEVFSNAILSAMASSGAPETARLGRVLQDIVSHLDGSDPEKALLLRLQYVAGLTPNEVSTLSLTEKQLLAADAATLALGAELKARNLSPNLLLRLNLRPRGEVTILLENVRDGQRPLGDVVVHEGSKLQRQASHLLRLEGGHISLQPEDLVNEMYLRMPKDAHKSPVNHMEFEALAKRIMRHVLIDRARRPLPTQSRFSDELREDIADSSDLVEDRLMMQQVVHIVKEVIRELSETDHETAEMLHATLYGDVDQKQLAKLYGVSISTVKRRVKDGRDLIRKRLDLEPSR
jgi:RNA polymerase sigma factor (sigma-70 family)